MLLLFSCVQFLTNYYVRKRKQHIDQTNLCELKTNFWAEIKSYETTNNQKFQEHIQRVSDYQIKILECSQHN